MSCMICLFNYLCLPVCFDTHGGTHIITTMELLSEQLSHSIKNTHNLFFLLSNTNEQKTGLF